MNDGTYFFIVRILDRCFWRGTLTGAENLPEKGPAVFAANHNGSNGPIGITCSIHMRFYPWIIDNMLDKGRAAEYLRIDFVEPALKLRPPLSRAVAKAISLISVPLLTTMGCIGVNRKKTDDIHATLQQSLALLKAGKAVLVFPEDPDLEMDPLTNMRPFMKGFTRLGELFYAETGKNLDFFPVAIHQSKKVMAGSAVRFDPDQERALERRRLKDTLENEIQAMYLELGQEG